jgi:hypothetical protein
VDILDVRTIGDTGMVAMNVQLRSAVEGSTGVTSQINAREGQTVVLGNGLFTLELSPGGRRVGTVILTVRPELVRQ